MSELAQRFPCLRYVRGHASTLILLGTMGLVLLPGLITKLFWLDHGRSRNDLMVFVLLPGIELHLMLLCPLALSCTNPPLVASNYKWFNWSRAEFLRLGLLPLGLLLIALVTIPFASYRTTTILHNAQHAAGIKAVVAIQYLVLRPTLEEFFWRGHVQSILGKALGASSGIVGQAILFTLTHFEPMLGLIYIFLFGLLVGIWRHKRNTLLPLIVTHSINNAVYIGVNWF
jgi:membrane protease YdiL (CAAX protease family)